MNRLSFWVSTIVAMAFAAASHQTGEPVIQIDPPAVQSIIVDAPFDVQSVKEKVLYTATGSESIEANGKTYMAFDKAPQPVAAVLLNVTGNGAKYVEISKVGSTDFPTVLDEYAPGKYVFEHSGAGVYHVRSVDSNGRPVYAKFTIGNPPPPPPGDQPPPPVTDHAELVKIVRAKLPADPQIAVALSSAYAGVAAQLSDGSKGYTIDQARAMSEQARGEALAAMPPLKVYWDEFLLAVGGYLKSLTTIEQYRSALTVLSEELKNARPAGVIPPAGKWDAIGKWVREHATPGQDKPTANALATALAAVADKLPDDLNAAQIAVDEATIACMLSLPGLRVNWNWFFRDLDAMINASPPKTVSEYQALVTIIAKEIRR